MISHKKQTAMMKQGHYEEFFAKYDTEAKLEVLLTELHYKLIEVCTHSYEEKATLSDELRGELESMPREMRSEVVNRVCNGCTPLFLTCRRGCTQIAEYLINICGADKEQRGVYEVPNDRSQHMVTPLWCAAVSGQLSMVKYLVRIGCDVNAASDTGSTPVRSACFMTHSNIVHYMVEHGADIHKANMNGGTCLINSVQSTKLCDYLLKRGVDVNAMDVQGKTAMHYAIQEHRLNTVKLLLQHGANGYIESRSGDDALRIAALKGADEIMGYLKSHLIYTPKRLAEAHELIGSTFFDENNDSNLALLHWRMAFNIRQAQTPYLEKTPVVRQRTAYNNAVEFRTSQQLDALVGDLDAMRMQTLMIYERILGLQHKDTLFRLTYRGAAYGDAMHLQRCIHLWKLVLETRIHGFTLLHTDTCFAAQALTRQFLDMQFCIELEQRIQHNSVRQNDNTPRFEDIMEVFSWMVDHISATYDLLQLRPVFRKQQDNFDRVLRCVTHLIYLLLKCANSTEQLRQVYCAVKQLVATNVRSTLTNDTLLHLSTSRLNVIRSGYFIDEQNPMAVFPNNAVIELLINCGANVNACNDSKSAPLHVASQLYNFENATIRLLLDKGADLDMPNRNKERPYKMIQHNPSNELTLMNYMSLKCLAAVTICHNNIDYKDELPNCLLKFVGRHKEKS